MTVDELVECLQRFPGGLRVVVNGYEEGYDDLSAEQVTCTRIGLNTGKRHWEGVHGHPDDTEEPNNIVDAVVLERTSH